MIEQSTLAIVGTGSLATSICYSLATEVSFPIRLLVLGRNAAKTAQICYVATARAALAGHRGVVFQPVDVDLTDDGALAEVWSATSPHGVVLAASSQSPWERQSSPSAWTALVQRAGFGLTLPFQAELALRVGRTLADSGAWLINACFPDGVNPLLAARDVPVLCGVGNVALLAASLQSALALGDQRDLAVLAHHVHLHTPVPGEEEALAWHADRPVADVGDLLAAQRSAARAELNHVTGYAAARLVRDLLTGAESNTSLPGPLGLPGGYPVRVKGGLVELRLPPGLTRADAVAFNQRAALRDGVVVDEDQVVFGPAAAAELRVLAPELADGFPVADLERATDRLDHLRAHLRNQSPPRTR